MCFILNSREKRIAPTDYFHGICPLMDFKEVTTFFVHLILLILLCLLMFMEQEKDLIIYEMFVCWNWPFPSLLFGIL